MPRSRPCPNTRPCCRTWKARACLADVPAYCLTDEALVDAAIQLDLDLHHHGRMPTNERWLDEHIGRARAAWNTEMKEEPDAVRARVAANWAEPRVEMVKGRADVYLHVPPGELTLHNGHWKSVSPAARGGEMVSTVVVEQLLHWAAERPKAKVVRLILDVPQPKKGFERFDVRWFKARSEVVVFRPKRPVAWTTGPDADLASYERAEALLRTDALQACAITRYGEPPDCEAPVEGSRGKGKAKGRGKAKGKRG